MKKEGGTRPERQAATDPLLILQVEGEPDDAWYEEMGQLPVDLLGPWEGLILRDEKAQQTPARDE
jgi:hypothetical protein